MLQLLQGGFESTDIMVIVIVIITIVVVVVVVIIIIIRCYHRGHQSRKRYSCRQGKNIHASTLP